MACSLKVSLTAFLLLYLSCGPSDCAVIGEIHIYKYDNATDDGCALMPIDEEIRDELAIFIERKSKLVEILVSFKGYDESPMFDPEWRFYQPWKWIRTTGRHGQALLMLPFHYEILSLSMLSIGAVVMNAELKDEPAGCFGALPYQERVGRLRALLLNDFKPVSQGLTGSLTENEYVCIQMIREKGMYGEFVYDCCRYGPDGDSICIDLTQEFWLRVLQGLLTFIKIVIFFFFPLMLPGTFYRPRYVQDKYKYELEKPVSISVYVTENADDAKAVQRLKRLTGKQLSAWPEFAHSISKRGTEKVPIPRNQRVNLPVENLYLQVQLKRIISKANVPVGVLTYLYNNFVRCKVRQVVPLNECCKASIFGSFAVPTWFPKMSWLRFCQLLVRFVLMMMLPFPFYIRLFIYSGHEHDEVESRKEALENRGLKEQFVGNFVQYLSPIHPLFIIIYIVYVIEGTGIRLLSKDLRERFKFVLRESFRDMKNINYRKKISKASTLLLYPLQNFGCAGFVIGVFYWIFTIPLLLIAGCFYFIPMIFITWRVVWSFISIIAELYTRRGKTNQVTQHKKIDGKFAKTRNDIGTRDFLPGRFDKDSEAGQTAPGFLRLKKITYLKEVTLQVFVMICSILTIYATTLLLVECVGFFVELASFTLMGIIVNAGQTMRYVTLLFLLWLYMHDCYQGVHDNYLALGQAIIDQAKDRVSNLEEVASKSAAEQANMGFIVKATGDTKIKRPVLSLDPEHELPRWHIYRPLLFLDNMDNPYVSVKFFESFNYTYAAGCPGPILTSLIRATKRFLSMVGFLGFVLIVVLAFGDSYNISTTNQTLATVVGGMLPWLLRKFVFAKKQTLCLNSFAFKYLFDEFARVHSKKWEISDIIIAEPPDEDDDVFNAPGEKLPEAEAGEEEDLETGEFSDHVTPSTSHIVVPNAGGEPPRVKPVDLLIDLSPSDKDVEFVSLALEEPHPTEQSELEAEREGLNAGDTSTTNIV